MSSDSTSLSNQLGLHPIVGQHEGLRAQTNFAVANLHASYMAIQAREPKSTEDLGNLTKIEREFVQLESYEDLLVDPALMTRFREYIDLQSNEVKSTDHFDRMTALEGEANTHIASIPNPTPAVEASTAPVVAETPAPVEQVKQVAEQPVVAPVAQTQEEWQKEGEDLSRFADASPSVTAQAADAVAPVAITTAAPVSELQQHLDEVAANIARMTAQRAATPAAEVATIAPVVVADPVVAPATDIPLVGETPTVVAGAGKDTLDVDADLAAAQANIDELLKQANFEDPSDAPVTVTDGAGEVSTRTERLEAADKDTAALTNPVTITGGAGGEPSAPPPPPGKKDEADKENNLKPLIEVVDQRNPASLALNGNTRTYENFTREGYKGDWVKRVLKKAVDAAAVFQPEIQDLTEEQQSKHILQYAADYRTTFEQENPTNIGGHDPHEHDSIDEYPLDLTGPAAADPLTSAITGKGPGAGDKPEMIDGSVVSATSKPVENKAMPASEQLGSVSAKGPGWFARHPKTGYTVAAGSAIGTAKFTSMVLGATFGAVIGACVLAVPALMYGIYRFLKKFAKKQPKKDKTPTNTTPKPAKTSLGQKIGNLGRKIMANKKKIFKELVKAVIYTGVGLAIGRGTAPKAVTKPVVPTTAPIAHVVAAPTTAKSSATVPAPKVVPTPAPTVVKPAAPASAPTVTPAAVTPVIPAAPVKPVAPASAPTVVPAPGSTATPATVASAKLTPTPVPTAPVVVKPATAAAGPEDDLLAMLSDDSAAPASPAPAKPTKPVALTPTPTVKTPAATATVTAATQPAKPGLGDQLTHSIPVVQFNENLASIGDQLDASFGKDNKADLLQQAGTVIAVPVEAVAATGKLVPDAGSGVMNLAFKDKPVYKNRASKDHVKNAIDDVGGSFNTLGSNLNEVGNDLGSWGDPKRPLADKLGSTVIAAPVQTVASAGNLIFNLLGNFLNIPFNEQHPMH